MFLETWMAGGLGRAQGPYDEMVFRSMVRDDSRFYDPLGLESRGHEGRLPGRRELVPLRHAVHDLARLPATSPRAGRATGCRAGRGAARTSRPSSGRSSGARSAPAWREWIDCGARASSTRTSTRSAHHPVTAVPRPVAGRALGSVSRAYVDPATRHAATPAVYHPGAVAHLAAIPLDGGPPR